MQSNHNTKYLWFLTVAFVMLLSFSNWFDPRIVKIFGLTTDAGTIIFPLSFLVSDLITEVYGYKFARRAIWVGFMFNVLFIIYAQIVIHLPNPDFATSNDVFDKILSMNMRVIFASILSYVISEPLNIFVLAKMKLWFKGKKMWARFVTSTLIASGFDSYMFGSIAFFGLMSNLELLYLILTMWLIKVFIEIVGLPVSITLAKKLKYAEKLDTYDDDTDFFIFSTDTKYLSTSNHYKN